VQMLQARLNGTPAKDLQEVWSPALIVRSSDGPKRATPHLPGGRKRTSRLATTAATL
jgi:hypothetical protein